MTGIVYHKVRRFPSRYVHHTYLFDVGNAIDVPLMRVSEPDRKSLLDPPYPKTSYFEIEIEEKRDGGIRTAFFQNIFPVRAEQRPDRYFLIFRIRRGSWSITERIRSPTDAGETQWVYTDDFNILFLSAVDRHDLDMLLNLVTLRLLAIAESDNSGNRLPSEFENQLTCRTAISTIFSEGVDSAFRDTAVYKDFGVRDHNKSGKESVPLSETEINIRHGTADVTAEHAAGLHVDISEIDELNDLSWLS